MKKLFLLPVIALICACSQQPSEPQNKMIRPLQSNIDVDNLTDATLAATFTSDDFGWMGGNLTMTVYAEELYDSADVQHLQMGDTLLCAQDTIVVSQIEQKNGAIVVNGGIEEGGAWLQPTNEGNYRAVEMDDHSIYTKLGEVELPLNDNFTIIDCGENPQDPYDTIRDMQKLYLENLQDSRKNFTELNTRVTIKKGLITNITRHWIP